MCTLCFPHFLEHCDFTVDDSSSSNNTVTSISSTDGSNSASESSSVPSVLFSRDDARRRIKRPAKRPAAAAVSSSSASTTAEAAAAVVTPAVQQQSSSQSPSMNSSLYEVITTTRTLYDNVWISSSGSLFEVAKPAKATTTTADVKKSKVSRTPFTHSVLGRKYNMKNYNLKKPYYYILSICLKCENQPFATIFSKAFNISTISETFLRFFPLRSLLQELLSSKKF